MNKTILTLLITIGFVGITFGQINVNGGIYSDSTLTKPISKVKLILKTANGKKTYCTDKNGKFNFVTKKNITKFSLEIKKKGFVTVLFTEINKNTSFDVIVSSVKSLLVAYTILGNWIIRHSFIHI